VNELRGQGVLITGASSGTGVAVARAFAAEGSRIALLARRRDALEAVAAELGGAAVVVTADVADPEQADSAVDEAVARLGAVDVAVNCAAVAASLSLAETTPARWQEIIDVNLSGTFYISRACGLHMLERGSGTIVNVASEAAMRGLGPYMAYCASKAGVVGLTRAMADELAPTVTVNCVCPGPIDTEMLRTSLAASGDPEGAWEQLMARVPLQRAAAPAEIAAGIVYFASHGRCTTGATLALDGGTTAVF
jgi:NAD(P)-dependent dehydrogenase (short-subunit alcohol dehydrogenase family)